MSTILSPSRVSSVTDRYGRTLRYLRLSVTDRCNLRCRYCNPNGTCPQLAPEPLSWDDLLWMASLAADRLGVEALRITGGEPTIRPGLVPWIHKFRTEAPSIKSIGLTTNGTFLESMARPLADAGVNRVNISIDSLRPERFRLITRNGDLGRVLAGLAAGREAFDVVKVNAVALRDLNLDELADFVEFSAREDVEVRFIEPMPLGNEKDYWRTVFVSCEELRQRLASRGFDLVPSDARTGYGPATTYTVKGSRARLGFISQMSCTKCAGCNKLRLTSDGTLRPCLLSAEEIPLQQLVKQRDSEGFLNTMSRAFLDRAAEYNLEEAMSISLGRSMQCIGG